MKKYFLVSYMHPIPSGFSYGSIGRETDDDGFWSIPEAMQDIANKRKDKAVNPKDVAIISISEVREDQYTQLVEFYE